MDNVFLTSQLRKYILDLDHTVITKPIAVTKGLVYEEHSIQYCRIKQLCKKHIPSVKVIWKNLTSSEATWETEEEIKVKYPHLFEAILDISDKIHKF